MAETRRCCHFDDGFMRSPASKIIKVTKQLVDKVSA